MNHYEVQILQAIINCGGQPGLLGSSNLKIVQFKSCVTKQGDTAKVDSFVLYHVDEDDTVCFFFITFLVLQIKMTTL